MTVQVKTAGQLEGRAVSEVYEMTLGLVFFPGLLLFFFFTEHVLPLVVNCGTPRTKPSGLS